MSFLLIIMTSVTIVVTPYQTERTCEQAAEQINAVAHNLGAVYNPAFCVPHD